MSVPILAAAMLLTGAPAHSGGTVPMIPVMLSPPPAVVQAVPPPLDTTVGTDPYPPVVAPESAIPTAPVILTDPITPPPASAVDATVAASDEIVVHARTPPPPGDPFQNVNAKSFEITQDVDRAIIRPVALTYQRIVPDPLRSGFRNFLNNLREPVVFLNYLLQFKPGKAAETLGRFTINSTIGAAGLFDIAKRKPFKLPRRKNGLGNTLGYYGVGPGPFFFLPIIGPTTLRDVLGDNLDRLVLPVAFGSPFNKPIYAITIGGLSSLDQRAEFDEKLQELHEGNPDPYAKTREDYLATRQAAIDALHVHKPKRQKFAPPPVVRTLP